MPRPVDLEKLREKGYYPFGAVISWECDMDQEALEKFHQVFKSLPETKLVHLDSLRAFGLTGERTIILHGYTQSPQNLQRLSKALTFNSKIEASFYHAVEVHELMGIY